MKKLLLVFALFFVVAWGFYEEDYDMGLAAEGDEAAIKIPDQADGEIIADMGDEEEDLDALYYGGWGRRFGRWGAGYFGGFGGFGRFGLGYGWGGYFPRWGGGFCGCGIRRCIRCFPKHYYKHYCLPQPYFYNRYNMYPGYPYHYRSYKYGCCGFCPRRFCPIGLPYGYGVPYGCGCVGARCSVYQHYRY
eukprot:gnl/Trimastix_PCT/3844.p1 GENE.gnl/Trimastix_PCT/3844~~gnl/Trimastix_PCT/3844.p1  ORF type:complete len:190 (+),score=33.95 gnl/Trimastix_PCT/3844:133-702(+)